MTIDFLSRQDGSGILAIAVVAIMVLAGGIVLYSDEADASTDTCNVVLVSNLDGVIYSPITVDKGSLIWTSSDWTSDIEYPTYSGKLFLGWYQDMNLTKPFYQNIVVDKNMMLYAKWMDIETDFGITLYDANFVMGNHVIDTIVVEKNTVASKPSDPVKSGYRFAGWYTLETDAETGEPIPVAYDFSDPVDNNMSLYAKWEERGMLYDLVSSGGIVMWAAAILAVIAGILAYVLRFDVKLIVLTIVLAAVAIALFLGVGENIYDSIDKLIPIRL